MALEWWPEWWQLGNSKKASFHRVNSHTVNCHVVNSHVVNLSWDQLPWNQFVTRSTPHLKCCQKGLLVYAWHGLFLRSYHKFWNHPPHRKPVYPLALLCQAGHEGTRWSGVRRWRRSSKLCTWFNTHWPIKWHWENSFQFHLWIWLLKPDRVCVRSAQWELSKRLDLS